MMGQKKKYFTNTYSSVLHHRVVRRGRPSSLHCSSDHNVPVLSSLCSMMYGRGVQASSLFNI